MIIRRDNQLTVELRGEDDQPKHIVGTAAVYYREGDASTEYRLWSRAVERIMPGAFDDAVREDDVRAFFNHDHNYILGRSKAGQGTLKLNLTAEGLAYDIEPSDMQSYRDVATALERGDVSGSSFAFTILEETWRLDELNDMEIREINKVKLYDVGPVVFPAYEGTDSGVRGDQLELVRRSNEAWKKSLDVHNEKSHGERSRELVMMEMRI